MNRPVFENSAIVTVPERLVLRGGAWRRIGLGVRYGLVIHPQFGPVLIDTGYGPRALAGQHRSLALTLYGAAFHPALSESGQPLAAIARAGFAAADVERIIVTHFHVDHVAALRDFPKARFIASGTAWQALKRMNAWQRVRHGIFLELLPPDFEVRLIPLESMAESPAPAGLGPGRDLWGDGTCLAVDLPGHSLGHFGLIWPHLAPPLLYATDTTWLSDALDGRLPGGLTRFVLEDMRQMRHSAARVAAFRAWGGEVVLCHDRVGT